MTINNFDSVTEHLQNINTARDLLYEGKVIQAEEILVNVILTLPSTLKTLSQKADYWDETIQERGIKGDE